MDMQTALKIRSTDVKNINGSGMEGNPAKEGNNMYWSAKLVKTSELNTLYKPYPFNRGEGEEEMDYNRVKAIAKSIIGTDEIPPDYNGTYWLVSPILVNKKTRMIVDGHYTKAALEKVLEEKGWDFEVLVIEREFPEGLTDRQIVSKFNTMRKAWTSANFIECYVMEGLPDYIKLRDAAFKLGAPFITKGKDIKRTAKPNYRYTAALVGQSQVSNLKKGTFKYEDCILERGRQVKALFDAMGGKQSSAWLESFIVAYCDLAKFDAKKVFNKLLPRVKEIDWSGDIGKTDYWCNELGRLVL